MIDAQPRIQRQRGQRHERQHRREGGARPAPRHGEQQRIEEVELLFHRQRPGVEQGVGCGERVEVAHLPPQHDIGDEADRARGR
jgi:hypothetical protein